MKLVQRDFTKSKLLKLSRVLLSAMIVVSSSIAAAQNPPASGTSNQPKRQTINFEDQLVKGELKRPELFQILQRRQFDFGRLIKLRENFKPEMRRNAEDIKRGGD